MSIPFPLTIVLDLDGTVVGDVTPQVIMYEIIEQCKHDYGKTTIKLPMNELHDQLQSGLIRPFFQQFVNDVSGQGVEFFVYTASEKKWAEFLVKQIEKVYNIRINRPIFTRDQCTYINKDYKKSLKTICPAVLKSINKRYATSFKEGDAVNKILVIDNREVYDLNDMKNNVLLCSTYNVAVPLNIPKFISATMYKQYKNVIQKILKKYFGDHLFGGESYQEFERDFYGIYFRLLSASCNDRSSKTDILFRRLRKVIIKKNLRYVNNNVLSYLSKKTMCTSKETKDVDSHII